MNVRRHDAVENLAFEFNVSERTIRRDIELLSLDYPIYTTQGNGGGVHIIDDCITGRKLMSYKQEELLQKLVSTLGSEDAEIMRDIIKTFTVPKKDERRRT